MNKELSIVFTCDEEYMFPTGMAIFSLLRSKYESTSYKIYILVNSLEIKYRDIIETMNRADFRIIFRKIENIEKYTSLASANRLPVSALYKFAISEMIPEEDVCLSLDGDIVVRHDLGELITLDMEDNYAAVVKDSPKTLDDYTEEKHQRYPGIFNKDYFNGGVLLLNLRKMREDNVPEKLCDYRANGYNQPFSMNQDSFNAIFYKRVTILPFYYNTGMHVFRYNKDQERFQVMKQYYDIDENKTEEDILEEAYIIHFSGKGKPWKYYDVFYADRYRDMYKQSPFKYEKMERISYYNDRIRKMIGEIYDSKDYRLGYFIMKIPRKIKNLFN